MFHLIKKFENLTQGSSKDALIYAQTYLRYIDRTIFYMHLKLKY